MTQYLTRRQVADQYPIGFSTLAKLAMGECGPPYLKRGRSVVYRRDQFEAWLDSHLHRKARKRGRPRKGKTAHAVP